MWIVECGFNGEQNVVGENVGGDGLAMDSSSGFEGAARRVRCGNASHGAGRSRKIASAFGLSSPFGPTKNPL